MIKRYFLTAFMSDFEINYGGKQMNNKKIITILSVIVRIVIVVISAILIINKNNETTKSTIAQQNIKYNDTIQSKEPIEESPTPFETPSSKISQTQYVSKQMYYIKVNNQTNTVTIYTKDEDGNYTIPIKAMVCSTGNNSPKNSKYQLKSRWEWKSLFGGVYGQYATHITGNILFHSVPYLKQYDNSSLEYWEYDKLGTTCSAGCIRLTVFDAKWIYDNCPIGTTVEFYSSSNPGPLGKPSAMKILDYTVYRNWDPTDPHPNNAWKNFVTIVPTPEPTNEPIIENTPVVITSEIPTIIPTQNPTEIPSVIPSIKSTINNETPKITLTPTTVSPSIKTTNSNN